MKKALAAVLCIILVSLSIAYAESEEWVTFEISGMAYNMNKTWLTADGVSGPNIMRHHYGKKIASLEGGYAAVSVASSDEYHLDTNSSSLEKQIFLMSVFNGTAQLENDKNKAYELTTINDYDALIGSFTLDLSSEPYRACIVCIVCENGIMAVVFVNPSMTPQEQDEFAKKIATSFRLATNDEIIAGNALIDANNAKASLESPDSYSVPEYDDYNSFAYENGRAGDLLRIRGTVLDYNENDGAYTLVLKQDDGNEWLVAIGMENTFSPASFEGLEGKAVEVFGEYIGFSAVLSLPAINLFQSGGILVKEGETYVGNITSLDGDIKEWMDMRAFKELFSYTNEYTAGAIISSGIITNVTHYPTIKKASITFVQLDENGFHDAFISCSYDDYPDVASFDYGSPISLYYFLDETTGKHELHFVTSDNHSGFTIDQYIDSYKAKCDEYTYNSIARNPSKVQGAYATVSGEVIQVIENGNKIELRVNITKESSFYKDTIYVTYTRKSDTEDRILEDDIITIWGTLEGLNSYETILGATVSLPLVDAAYIHIDSQD